MLLAAAMAIFLFVMALLAAALLRRRKKSHDDAASEKVWFWGLGLAFPAVTLAALTAYGLITGERLVPRPAANLVTVAAEGRQWAWTFRYADAPGRTSESILHIPAGRPVDVEITSRDVLHSFWVPRLAGKLDAIPGHVNVLRIEAGAPGDYAGVSGEYNGPGYREHTFIVRALDDDAWTAFLSGTQP